MCVCLEGRKEFVEVAEPPRFACKRVSLSFLSPSLFLSRRELVWLNEATSLIWNSSASPPMPTPPTPSIVVRYFRAARRVEKRDGGVLLRRIANASWSEISVVRYSSHLGLIASGSTDGSIQVMTVMRWCVHPQGSQAKAYAVMCCHCRPCSCPRALVPEERPEEVPT